jgi:hypothetical protein
MMGKVSWDPKKTIVGLLVFNPLLGTLTLTPLLFTKVSMQSEGEVCTCGGGGNTLTLGYYSETLANYHCLLLIAPFCQWGAGKDSKTWVLFWDRGKWSLFTFNCTLLQTEVERLKLICEFFPSSATMYSTCRVKYSHWCHHLYLPHRSSPEARDQHEIDDFLCYSSFWILLVLDIVSN